MFNEIIRYQDGNVEGLVIQRDNQTGERKIRGLAACYYNGSPGTQYALPNAKNVIERIQPGAFDHLLNTDVIACRDHDTKLIVGRNGKTLKLWTTERGLEYEITLANTTAANDLWSDVQAGNIKGSSFKARHMLDNSGISWGSEGGKDIMTIKRFSSLADVSCVCSPAYPATDCSAVIRSLEDYNAMQATIERLARMQKILAQA